MHEQYIPVMSELVFLLLTDDSVTSSRGRSPVKDLNAVLRGSIIVLSSVVAEVSFRTLTHPSRRASESLKPST